MTAPDKQHHPSQVLDVSPLTGEMFRLSCLWPGPAPKAGQFFMLKPRRSAVFLPRPISAAFWEPAGTGAEIRLGFLVLRRGRRLQQGRGTEELAALHPGECVELSGPLGNSWEDFTGPPYTANEGNGLCGAKSIALVGGGIGIAPLLSLTVQYPGVFDFYAGFRNAFTGPGEQSALLYPAENCARKLTVAAENETAAEPLDFSKAPRRGRILDFLNPETYRAVCACGPEAMLRAVAAQCRTAGVPCYVSLERRMACGAGACLGCTVETTRGNRRCCADGPIFNAEDVFA